MARRAAEQYRCPILDSRCEKQLHTTGDGPAGVCSIKPMTSSPVVCCPIRLYADEYRVLRDVADIAFGPGPKLVPGGSAVPVAMRDGRPVVAVFGKRWGGELRVPKKSGTGGYWVDWVLALVNERGDLEEFVAVEVQTIDTTGNYKNGRRALLDTREVVKTTVGLNWENVNKRILPQLVYKGQLLQRESLCRKGLFFVAPRAVYNEVIKRVGGVEKLPTYALQPASVTFLAYDYLQREPVDGDVAPLERAVQHSTTVYKLQEAFNNVQLTDADVYTHAILDGLGLA
ncbi:hypothetical protein LGT36_002295 [Demequina sp. TMPB413]|uniref:NotI family restriction endonuclease n=1 Tax=Demequina sp. TMPB413 TaxID=2881056 RepID=UPI002009F97A|nr:hypothetical protein LGT36_002295 [Demequina sp. TMPB413]